MKEKKQSDVLISSDQLLLYGIFFMFCANLVFMSSYYELIGYSCYAIGCSIIYLYLF